MSTQKCDDFTRPPKEAGYSVAARYHKKLAKMMSSSSFSTYAGCNVHQTYAASARCMIAIICLPFCSGFCAALQSRALSRV